MKLSHVLSLRILQLLEERDWYASTLSFRSAVPNNTLSNIISEKGTACNLLTVYNLCRGLDVHTGVFFGSNLFNFENVDDN